MCKERFYFALRTAMFAIGSAVMFVGCNDDALQVNADQVAVENALNPNLRTPEEDLCPNGSADVPI